MKIIEPSYEIITPLDGEAILKHIEQCGRVCYKSESKIEDGSAEKFVRSIIKRGHESVLEHFSFTVKFIVDRGVSHELVRHRLASYSQESTRYCCYSNDKFGNEITVVKPSFTDETDIERDGYWTWVCACEDAEHKYNTLIRCGWKPQEARSVLPNSLKTEVMMTANIREWRSVLRLRTSPAAHPDIRAVMIPLLNELKEKIPVLFDDIEV